MISVTMKTTGRKFTAAFRAKVVVEALREYSSLDCAAPAVKFMNAAQQGN